MLMILCVSEEMIKETFLCWKGRSMQRFEYESYKTMPAFAGNNLWLIIIIIGVYV